MNCTQSDICAGLLWSMVSRPASMTESMQQVAICTISNTLATAKRIAQEDGLSTPGIIARNYTRAAQRIAEGVMPEHWSRLTPFDQIMWTNTVADCMLAYVEAPANYKQALSEHTQSRIAAVELFFKFATRQVVYERMNDRRPYGVVL